MMNYYPKWGNRAIGYERCSCDWSLKGYWVDWRGGGVLSKNLPITARRNSDNATRLPYNQNMSSRINSPLVATAQNFLIITMHCDSIQTTMAEDDITDTRPAMASFPGRRQQQGLVLGSVDLAESSVSNDSSSCASHSRWVEEWSIAHKYYPATWG